MVGSDIFLFLIGYFWICYLASLSLLSVTRIGFFFCAYRPMGVELGLTFVSDLKDLPMDSLIRRAASISLENEGKDRF